MICTPPIKYVPKGWGSEEWIVNKEYCGKILRFYKGKKLSWHYHKDKHEVFYLLSGKLIIKYNFDQDITKADQTILYPNMSFEVPQGLCHQMIAEEDSVLIEFSSHHEDSDSFRIICGD